MKNPSHPSVRQAVAPGAFSDGTILRWLLFAHLLLSPLVFWKETTDVFEMNKVSLLTVVAIVLSATGLSVLARRYLHAPGPMLPLWQQARNICRQPAVAGVLLFLVSAVVSTFASISPLTSFRGASDSLGGLATILAYTILFFATCTVWRSPADGRALLIAPVWAAAVASGYALIQVIGLDPLPWDGASQFAGHVRPFATMGHPNFLAAFLVMVFPLVAYFTLCAIRRQRWCVATGLLLIAIASGLVILAAMSRGAWLAFAATLTVLAAAWYRAGERRTALGLASLFSAAGMGLVGLWFVVPAGDDGGRLRDRLHRFGEADGRQYIWQAGMRMFAESPWVGSGLDTFALAFGRHRDVEYWDHEWNVTPAKAHNEAIHILATQGLLGGAAALLIIGGLACAALRAWRPASSDEKLLLGAVLAGVAGFGIQNLFSFTVAGCGTLFVTFAALLTRWGQHVGQVSNLPGASAGWKPAPRPRWARLLVRPIQLGIWAAAVAAIMGWVVRPLQASRACRIGESWVQHDPRQALKHLEKAVLLDPSQDWCWVKLSEAAQVAARRTADPGEQRRLLLRARESIEQAIRLVPVSAYHHANHGRLLGEMAQVGLANATAVLAAFDLALAADPNNVNFHADAATAAVQLGEFARARRYANKAPRFAPRFAPLHALLGYLALAEDRLPEALQELLLALRLTWPDPEWTAATYANLSATLLKLRQPEDALHAAALALTHSSRCVDARFNRARSLELLGRHDEAVAEYRRLLTAQPDHGPARAGLHRLDPRSHHSTRLR